MLSNIGRAAVRRVVVAGGQQSTNRAFQCIFYLRRVEKSKDSSSRLTSFLSTRCSYVTTTSTKAPAKKKATAKKTPAAKPKAQKAATKKAVKKPAKKKVIKAAKPKPNKKRTKRVLTEEQKSALAAKSARAALRELKKTALSPPPSKPSTVWRILISEATKTKTAGARSTVADNSKSASATYKSLTPEQLESYNQIANQNKAANEIAYKKWVESHTPDEIRIANNARRLLNRKDPTRKIPPIKDSRLPKRAVTAMLLFYAERHASGDFKGIEFPERAKLIHNEWTTLSAAQRQPYEERAAVDKQRYQAEFKTVYHRDSAGT